MSAILPDTTKTVAGRSLPPPIYHLSGAAEKRSGDHTHDTWKVRVVHEAFASQSMPMIVKSVPSPITMAVEIACAMAARELRLNVPQPGLVVADREDLPDLDENVVGDRLLLVGSHYQRPDAFFAEAVDNDAAAEELIWSKVCESPVAKQGAAWDELIANPDRHCENVLYDGTTWWLFDHDQALAPAASFATRMDHQQTRQDAIAYNANANLLLKQLLTRYSGQHQAILEQSRRLDSGAKRLHALASYAVSWTHADQQISDVLQLIGVVLALIHLRLPTLAEKIQMRINPNGTHTSLWTSPAPKP